MGLGNTIQSTPSVDQQEMGETELTRSAQAGPHPLSGPTPERQCGRCRQFFPVDSSASPQGKWWACPDCHHTLFDGRVGLFDKRHG